MHFTTLVLTALPAAFAVPYSSFTHVSNTTTPTPSNSTNSTSNPFAGKSWFGNPNYAIELQNTKNTFIAANDTTGAEQVETLQASNGVFTWISSVNDVQSLEYVIDAAVMQNGSQVVGVVVYDIPNRDCSAGASSGEFDVDDGGLEKYQAYIDSIAAYFRSANAQRLTFAVVLEPDSLANLVTNLGVETCAAAADVYKEGIAYAISALQFSNVYLYLDAAHGGWLGWDDNLQPAAELFAEVLGKSNGTVRGLATNVSNYNPFKAAAIPTYAAGSKSYDELHYAQNLQPYLKALGFPVRFIIDQGRSGNVDARSDWSQWCNVKNAGYGSLPTAETGEDIVDALVWVKPGGESDGTSDPSSSRYVAECSAAEGAKTPAPDAGAWFDAYVVDLIKNADPAVAV